MSDQGDVRGAGWVAFASMVMIVVGGWGILQGLFALIDGEEIAQLGGHTFILDTTGWGWMSILVGALVLFVGLGIASGSRAAQGIGVFLVVLNAIGQVFTISVYPFWGLTLLVMDILVIWALCVYRAPRID